MLKSYNEQSRTCSSTNRLYEYNLQAFHISQYSDISSLCKSLHWAMVSEQYTVWPVLSGQKVAISSAVISKYEGSYRGHHGLVHIYSSRTGRRHAVVAPFTSPKNQ